MAYAHKCMKLMICLMLPLVHQLCLHLYTKLATSERSPTGWAFVEIHSIKPSFTGISLAATVIAV